MTSYYDYHDPHHHHNNNYHHYQYGGQGVESSVDEYLDRVTMLQRMPSVAADIPTEASYAHGTRNDSHKKINHHHNRAPHKKVHIVEHEKVVDIGRDRRQGVYEEDLAIDTEADGFIKQKHKNFEMSKWDSMRPAY